MATIDPVIVKLQADVSDLQKGLQQANGYLKGLDDQVKKADTAFAGMSTRLKQLGATIGITFGASQLVSFFKQSVAASLEAEASQERLRQLLLNTNGATEAQITALNNQAKALEAVGVVSADNITVAQSQLATFDLSAAAIGKLTPAILDYVTAEKGATASADDFKGMTNSLAQALQGNFASLTKVGFVLDDATKKQIANGTEMERAAALVEVLNSTYKDFNKNLRDTSAGGLQVAINDINNLKQQIGDGLRPVVDSFAAFLSKTLIPALSQLVEFLTENKDTIIAVTKVLFAGVAAYTAYRVAITATKVATAAFQVVMVLMKGAQLASIASTNGLAASMLALNAAMKANPIGMIITGITLATAAIIALWKNSETFRSVVISVAKAALNAFASIVPMVAKVFEAIMKVVTGPMRLFLGALSKLPGVGKYAKGGLDLINKGLNGISDLGDKAAKKATELSNKLDGLAKSAKKAGDETKNAKKAADDFGKGRNGGAGGLTEEQKKKLDGYKDKVKDIYKDINETITEANEKAKDALDRRNERMLEAEQRFADTKKDLDERLAEQLKEAQDRFDETKADLLDRRNKAETAATKKHAEAILSIKAEYRKKEIDLAKTRDDKLAELEAAAQRKRADIVAKGAEKLRDIVEKSRQSLRDAFIKGTEFKLEDLFGAAKQSGGTIVDAIKNQLKQTKDLQKGAGDLAGAGFSQAFIEQIVKAGPEAGLTMIEEIKKLSPEQQKEVRNMYNELDSISQNGMDAIANTLSTSTNLVTGELRRAYQDTQQDIANALREVDEELKINVAEAKKTYSDALAEAATLRDERLAEADKALKDALAESKASYDEALADAQKTLQKAQEEAKKTFDKGLLEAQKTLQKALEDAQKDYEKAIDEINKATQKKLNDLMAKLREVAAAMAAISKGSAAGVVSGAPSYTPVVPAPITTKPGTVVTPEGKVVSAPSAPSSTPEGSIYGGFDRRADAKSMDGISITQNFTNVAADAWDIHEKTLSAIRYGTAITPKPTTNPATSNLAKRTGGGTTREML
jgi:hypothetical protein